MLQIHCVRYIFIQHLSKYFGLDSLFPSIKEPKILDQDIPNKYTRTSKVQLLVSRYHGKTYTMKAKEHSQKFQEKVTEKHKSGDVYKKLSKSLNIPLNAVKSVIMGWQSGKSKSKLCMETSGRPLRMSNGC